MEKFYITTAIDYVNGFPHLGHAVQKIWADVIARYHRQNGREVYFLTGTDEHGSSVARAAEKQGKTPKELADENSEKFFDFKIALNLSWDDFIRTSDQAKHWPGAILMWNKLVAAGDIYLKKYQGLYCVGHESFITEKELVDGLCPLHKTKPDIIEEENHFFRLSKYTNNIKEKIKKDELLVIPETRKNEILGLLNDGLEDISFSRKAENLPWGIPVPNNPAYTQYVWCDALTSYISALGFGQIDDRLFQKYWPANVHVLGKDNLRFHAALWPGMLLSAGLPLPKKILCHGFIGVDGQKMSKTIGNVIDPFQLVEKYGTDVVRYYFARETPTYEDGDFSYKKLEDRYNGDLANNLGNLVSRVAKLIETKLNGELIFEDKFLEATVAAKIEQAKLAVDKNIADFKLHEAIAQIWELFTFANGYIDNGKPWAETDPEKLLQTLTGSVTLLTVGAKLLWPFLPTTAEKILAVFGRTLETTDHNYRVVKIEPLFPRI